VPSRIPLHWLVFVIAILLTTAAVYFSLYAPHGADADRGLQLVLTATAVAWILWGQMANASRRSARADADEYISLIARSSSKPIPFRRRPHSH
jgi:hypothetical protein